MHRRHGRRSRQVIVTLALLLPLLAGGGFAGQAGVAAQDAAPVTLDLWLVVGTEEPAKPFLQTLAEAYEAAHPNVTVEVTLIPEDQYVVKLDTALAAASPPDIAYLFEPRWVKAGKVLPLDETISVLRTMGCAALSPRSSR